MDVQVAERFERIEGILEQTARMCQQKERALGGLAALHEQQQKTLGWLVQTIDHYVTASDLRMKRIEENLRRLDSCNYRPNTGT